MKGDVIDVGIDLRFQHDFNPGTFIGIGVLIEKLILVRLADEMVHVVLEEGHVGDQQLIGALCGLKIVRIPKGEVEGVPTDDPIGVDLCGMKDDLT